jgi:cytochrome c oxidase subunit 3
MSAIPYSGAPRPDTGLYNGKVGTWLVLAAEAMFFGALFSSYVFLRTAATEWPDGASVLPAGLGAANVLCVILLAIAGANAWLHAGTDRATLWLWFSVGLGIVSVILIAVEHRVVVDGGAKAATSTFYGMYYLLTGLLRFHVIGGVLVAFYLVTFGKGLLRRDRQQYANRIECLGLYWQFIGVISIVTFVLLYMV